MFCIDCSAITPCVMIETDCGVSRSGVFVLVAVELQPAEYRCARVALSMTLMEPSRSGSRVSDLVGLVSVTAGEVACWRSRAKPVTDSINRPRGAALLLMPTNTVGIRGC